MSLKSKHKGNRVPVMVTGVGGGGHGEQIVKALKLATTDYEIIGGDMSSVSKGLAVVDHPYLLLPASHADYLPAVLAVCKKHGVVALFHGSEPELKVMSKERVKIEAQGIFLPINPSSVIDLCMDKAKTMKWLTDAGFCVPRTAVITSLSDLDRVDFSPVVLKPSVGGGGSANIMIAQTEEEVQYFGKYLLSIYPEFIIQEYMGTPEDEYTVGVLLSMDGELLNSIAVKRFILSSLSNRLKVPNRTKKSQLGPVLAVSSGVSQGEIGPFPEVTKQCEEIALALGCRGAVNIQCRFVNGKVHVFEINPRFSGTTSLRAMVGYNEPDTLIRRHVFGESIEPHAPYKTGFIMRGLEESFLTSVEIPEARELVSC